MSIGDKVTFFAEKERKGVWDGKAVRDENDNPWGLIGILNSTDGWLRNDTKSIDAVGQGNAEVAVADVEKKENSDNGLKFRTHTGEEVSGKRLTDALNKVADDMVESANKKRKEHYASHITEQKKDEILAKDLDYAEKVRNGESIDNFTTQQRINTELTGESVPLFAPEKTENKQSLENKTGDTLTNEVTEKEKNSNAVTTPEITDTQVAKQEVQREIKHIEKESKKKRAGLAEKNAILKNQKKTLLEDLEKASEILLNQNGNTLEKAKEFIKDGGNAQHLLPKELSKETVKQLQDLGIT
ncbi:MAG TPA: hypothetical protein PK564_03360, partial [bacterium]|nr:hypothetical protein [bacterium]